MINIEQAKKKFLEEVQKYDQQDENIARKVGHSFRVMNMSKKIATKIGLLEEEIEVATLIGLLHDIGRFKQYQNYHTYQDFKSVDHAKLGVEILFSENKIREYAPEDKYDTIMREAILQHNNYTLDKTDLTEKEELFCKIIKDADKIDILFEATTMFWKDKEEQMRKSIISQEVFDTFMNEKLIRHEIKNTLADEMVGIISYIYDIHFKESFLLILEENYLLQIMERFHFSQEDTKKKLEKIDEKIKDYLKKYIL